MEWEEFAEKVKVHILLKWVLFRIYKMKNEAIKKAAFAFTAAICLIVGTFGAVIFAVMPKNIVSYEFIIFGGISATLAIAGFAHFFALLKLRCQIL